MNIITSTQAAVFCKLSRNTIVKYETEGCFPKSIENERGLKLYFKSEVIDWYLNKRDKIVTQYKSNRGSKANKTRSYIEELERKLMMDQLINR